jgi:hypothetical protein
MDKLISCNLKNWAALRRPPSNIYKRLLKQTSMLGQQDKVCTFYSTKFMGLDQQKIRPLVGVWGLRPFSAGQIWSYHIVLT